MTSEHLEVAGRTGWVEHNGTVYAARLPDGPPLVLAGAGAVIWLELAEGGTLDEVTERVADAVGSTVETVTTDVATFVAELVDLGLVARRTVPAVPAATTE